MKIVPIRMPDDWRRALRCHANREQMTVSDYLRDLFLADLPEAKRKELSKINKRGGNHE